MGQLLYLKRTVRSFTIRNLNSKCSKMVTCRIKKKYCSVTANTFQATLLVFPIVKLLFDSCSSIFSQKS